MSSVTNSSDEARLNYEEQSVMMCDYFELERFIRHHYPALPKTWNLLGTQEWPNDSYHHFTVVKGPLSNVDEEDLEGFKEDGGVCSLHVILQDLCNRNEINPGHYVIHVSW